MSGFIGYDMSRHVRQSNLIEGVDDPLTDSLCLTAWRLLIRSPVLELADIFAVHRIVTERERMRPSDKGQWRHHDVTVGGRTCPTWAHVPGLMASWLEEYRSCEPRNAHVRFELIHPFADGNGRTGRLLMWHQEAWNGDEPTLILDAHKAEYYRWFEVA